MSSADGSFSNEDDLSLGADQEEAYAPTCDAASSSAVSQRGQFIRKYQAHWKNDLSMLVCLCFSFFIYTYNIIY
jgi:hypothetical protein